MRSSSL